MNVVMISGRIANKPDIRFFQGDRQMVKFNLEVEYEGRGRDYDYPTVVATDKMARYVMKNFFEGDRIAVRGALSTRATKEGEKRTEVFAHRIEAASGKKKCYME